MKLNQLSRLAALTILAVCLVAEAEENPGICPEDNGKYRKTSAGTFLITCGKQTGRSRMDTTPQKKATFAECIDSCAARTGCKSVDYDVGKSECWHMDTASKPALPNPAGQNFHNARLAKEPAPPPPPPPPPVPSPDPVPSPVVDPAPDQDSNAISAPQTPKCPGDNGKAYITSDGTYFKLLCNHWSEGSTKIQESTAASYADCMEKCAAKTGCNAISFLARAQEGITGGPQNQCFLWTSDGNSGDSPVAKAHDFAYTIDPPPIQSPDLPNELCTTECPRADGMSYTSSYGETFRMDCGKRHGTAYMSVLQADSFKECMETCAALVPCHSVDYQAKTKKCYLGSHHGNPIIIASSFDSAHSLGCANACLEGCCGNGSKANRTTALNRPGPDLSCGNQGVEYAMYPNTKNGVNNAFVPPDDANFDPSIFKTATPEAKGKTAIFGFSTSTDVYGKKPSNPEFNVVNHRGYLYARQTGEYVFSAPSCNEMLFLWIGPKAYNGYTRANADLTQNIDVGGGKPITFSMTLTKGMAYPIRLLWENSGGPGYFQFEVKAPDGSVVVDGKSASQVLIQYSCDGISSPRFPPFGSETSSSSAAPPAQPATSAAK